MPKGSKKRKAERRKKEKESINSSNGGEEDLNSHQDNEIHEDLCSYTATATTLSHRPLGQKDEEREDSRDALSAESATSVNNDETIERSEIGGDREEEVVSNVRDLKLEEEVEEEDKKIVVIEQGGSESRVINIDDVETLKESNCFGSSSEFENSSGSSSDEESRSIDKKEDNCNSVTDSSPQVENLTDQQAVSISEEVSQMVEVTSAEIAEDSGPVVGFTSEEMVPVIDASSIIETGNGGKHVKEFKTLATSNNQNQQVAPAPQSVQATSWKGCCGLFDVFMGSNR